MKKRIEFIDIAKGIAIICIILGHLNNQQINKIVFTFHVPIFFIITGYFISSKYSMKEFIKNKFKRLIIPYIITCLLMIIISLICNSIVFNKYRLINDCIYLISASLYGARRFSMV